MTVSSPASLAATSSSASDRERARSRASTSKSSSTSLRAWYWHSRAWPSSPGTACRAFPSPTTAPASAITRGPFLPRCRGRASCTCLSTTIRSCSLVCAAVWCTSTETRIRGKGCGTFCGITNKFGDWKKGVIGYRDGLVAFVFLGIYQAAHIWLAFLILCMLLTSNWQRKVQDGCYIFCHKESCCSGDLEDLACSHLDSS